MHPPRVTRPAYALPRRPPATTSLALAALLSASVATCRLRTADATPPATGAARTGAPTVVVRFPMASTRPADARRDMRADTAPALGGLRARLQRGDRRVPATQVDEWILRFATDPGLRASVEAGLGRMARYEPFVRNALRRQGLPEELLHLVMIESRFTETAVSSAGATGMWQFMAATGRMYGLEVSEYVDERRDPVRSTQAAARHLVDLHERFGSWHLALAAYNAGAGRVDRALRRAGRVPVRGDERIFWQVRHALPAETRQYVPMVLAAAAIAAAPESYGFHVRPEPALTFTAVWIPGGVSLESVARDHRVPAEHVRALNPHLVRGTTPPGRPWPVRLPAAPDPHPETKQARR